MLLSYSVENWMTFSETAALDFAADKRIRHLSTNLLDLCDEKYVKSLGVFGPNNSGKTALIRSLQCLQLLMKGEALPPEYSAFAINHERWRKDDHVVQFALSFAVNGRKYDYALGFQPSSTISIVYEELYDYSKGRKRCVYAYGPNREPTSGVSRALVGLMKGIAPDTPLIRIVKEELAEIKQIKDDFLAFANSLLFFIPSEMDFRDGSRLTHEYLREGGEKAEKIIDFIKGADAYLDNVRPAITPNEGGFDLGPYGLWTTYNGFTAPAVIADSLGTKKIEALAGFIFKTLENDGILVVDELDSSLFYLLSRAIVSLFNNVENKGAQLLFTSHDLNLLDTRRLMRKEQIVFITRPPHSSPVLVPLKSKTAGNDRVRSGDDIAEKYVREMLVDLPDPSLTDILFDIKRRKGGVEG